MTDEQLSETEIKLECGCKYTRYENGGASMIACSIDHNVEYIIEKLASTLFPDYQIINDIGFLEGQF